MFKKMSKIEKIVFVIVMLVNVFVYTSTNIPTIVRYKVNELITKNENGNYRLNKNYVELAIHDDDENIIDYVECWIGNLDSKEEVEEYLSLYWKLAPEGVNEYNYENYGYSKLMLKYSLFEETGRYIVPEI